VSWYIHSQTQSKLINRSLGKTGWEVPLFSLGGQSLIEWEGKDKEEQAIEVIETFLKLGGKYIDTSPEYTPEGEHRLSERRIAQAIKGIDRNSFYLATKTEEREAEAAWRDINESVETLGTTVNCIQIHHLNNKNDVNQIFAKKGVLKALLKAQDAGLTQFLGITGHSDPNILLNALYSHPFDTVLGAFNPADIHMGNMAFQKKLIPYCKKHDIGFIAMKVCSRGALFGPRGGLNSMREALYYIWSFPISTAIIGINNISQLKRNMDLARKFRPISEEKLRLLEDKTEIDSDNIMYFNKNGNEDQWKYYEEPCQTPIFTL
jgi:hypothetical protein